ncbi:MAG TPA: hypothetical protein ENK84_01135 [Desulfobulbus sp.]|nr:hypothetical protein [Desulfobulbus sp.]
MHDLPIQQLADTLQKIGASFSFSLDWNRFEIFLRDALYDFIDQIMLPALQAVLEDREGFLPALKQLAACKGMRFCGFRRTSVRIFTGRTLSISSPWFTKAPSKRKRKKAPNGSGCHLGLEVLGFIERVSTNLASNVMQLAILCPSFDIAGKVLREQGISLDVKTIRRLCRKFGQGALQNRGAISFNANELDLKNITVLICMDGGRLRQRKRKKGRRPATLKRQGYTTDWVEPKLLTIQFLDADGKLIREIPPIYDATLGNIESFFDLLEVYLQQLDPATAGRVVFCADGAPCLWKRIPELMARLGVSDWYEALDYTHAKQNLNQIAEMIPRSLSRHRQEVFEYWKDLLWHGEFDELRSTIEEIFRSPKKRAQALKKFDNYFAGNKDRMHYSIFKEHNLPTGSGAVESAIRRVINLRLKGAGIFWTAEMAEVMLFLRSQFLCGRWNIVLGNLVNRKRELFMQFRPPMTNTTGFQQAA